ncbi:MAG TPA: PepSY domain-containing protein [Xanthomonadaceae bacterium]|nr:PepSY domain-containing protein [Xanthomonadaceae bacterium]
MNRLRIRAVRLAPLVLALAVAGTAGIASAQQPATQATQRQAMTEAQVRASLEANGYTSVNDVKFEDGVWKADARSADGNRVDVRVDATTGVIRPDEQVATMSEADVRAALAAQGYTNVHDVDYEDGIWNAEADDPAGKDVELKIDPDTGKVMGQEKD